MVETASFGEEPAFGYCDGVRAGQIYGWAWQEDMPDRAVTIEIVMDGRTIGTVLADVYRADLRAAGKGHGRYGFYFPLPRLSGDRQASFEVRVQDGSVLHDGAFEYGEEPDIREGAAAALVDAVLARERRDAPPLLPHAAPPTRFLVYSAAPPDTRTLGAADYSYGFVAKAFLPVLERLGSVTLVDGSRDGVDQAVDDALGVGEATVLLSFAPPHRTPLGVRCPAVPVVAWEYPTIPEKMWDGEPRNDWSFVLRQTGRAIALCSEATAAFRGAMGADYPAITVPTPVWDRLPHLHQLGEPEASQTIEISGFVFDSRSTSFSIDAPIPSPPSAEEQHALPRRLETDGLVFATVLAPKDGRKNWTEIVTAFVAAHRDHADATLVVKMIGADPGLWWYELHELLGRQASFACRVAILHGYLDDASYGDLVRATHWVVNASRCEGQCLPLLEFMSGGRPAIAPAHSAMKDYISPENALVVAATEEYCGFPHDPANEMTTVRHRIDWTSLREAFSEAYRIYREEPERYRRLAHHARARVRDYCCDDVVMRALDGFLGLDAGLHSKPPPPAGLLREWRA